MLAVLVLAACAPAPAAEPTPSEVAALERRVASDSADMESAARLGAAYRRLRRADEARLLLERVVAERPDDATAVLILGLTYEDLAQFDRAKLVYDRYLEDFGTSRVADRIRARMPLIQRRELEESVRQAIRDEARLNAATTDPAAVGVFPFLYDGSDPELQPLGRALAELLTTDLSQTDRLRVVERSRVQFLLDELALARTQLVDSTTAAQSGRLLGAGRIVQGRIDGTGESLRLEAALVRANDAGRLRTVEDEDALERLFDLEKRIALELYASLGIELTAAERERVNQRPTQNLQAVLAFGRGLIASDAGDFDTAAREFEQAASLDGGFSAAREQATRASQTATAAVQTTDQVATQVLPAATDLDALLAAIESIVPTAAGRDPASEALGTEGLGGRTILEIIIRRD
jgi:TolB-like protein/Tfp pilus assembly protein PilF